MINDLTEEERRILSIIMSDNQEDSDLATIMAVKKMGKDRVIDLIRDAVLDKIGKVCDNYMRTCCNPDWTVVHEDIYFSVLQVIETDKTGAQYQPLTDGDYTIDTSGVTIIGLVIADWGWQNLAMIPSVVLTGVTDKVNKLVNGQE